MFRSAAAVLAFDENDMKTVRHLYENGVANGVPDMKILSGDEVRAMEPNVSPECVGALFAPSAGIVNPWEMALAMAEQAVENGVDLKLCYDVDGIAKRDGVFVISGKGKEDIEARFVVNAAGVYSDDVARMVGDESFSIDASRGQYYLLDKSQGELFDHVMFQCPGPLGKGILVAPTVHGNLIVGPDANPGSDKENVKTDREGLNHVIAASKRTTTAINFRENIRNFAGLRSQPSTGDFIVGFSEADDHFVNAAGIKSPGLSAAPAIAAKVAEMLLKAGVPNGVRENYIPARKHIRFKELSDEQKAEIIKARPDYGRVVCRCETITEGEIVDALHGVIVPRTLDGIKRRCNAGMGRCQSGFCGPKVLEIIARELNMNPVDVLLDKEGSYILTGKTAKGEDR